MGVISQVCVSVCVSVYVCVCRWTLPQAKVIEQLRSSCYTPGKSWNATVWPRVKLPPFHECKMFTHTHNCTWTLPHLQAYCSTVSADTHGMKACAEKHVTKSFRSANSVCLKSFWMVLSTGISVFAAYSTFLLLSGQIKEKQKEDDKRTSPAAKFIT